MTWIETWTGERVHPMDPSVDEIHLEDIAHGLAYKSRYNGLGLYYSVAEHSVHLADWCLREKLGTLFAVNALMHDAAEAYLPDIATPIKRLFPDFERCETRLLRVILNAFGICAAGARTITAADTRILLNERAIVLPNHRTENLWAGIDGLEPLSGVAIHCWPPEAAEEKFLRRFRELTAGL